MGNVRIENRASDPPTVKLRWQKVMPRGGDEGKVGNFQDSGSGLRVVYDLGHLIQNTWLERR